jgi:putative nucleotidyltransferase with HDIG domain
VKAAARAVRDPIQVGLRGDDPALRELCAWLGEDFIATPEAAGACDVRLVGPAELAAQGARGLRQLRSLAPRMPLLVVVPDAAPRELVRECFRAGAQDVLTLAEAPHCLAAALRRALEREDAGAARALEQLRESYEQTLKALVSALDLREQETADHSMRVALYALRLALRLRLPEESLRDLYHGALLHDIGKIGIPDEVLLKPGRLSEAEWEIMRTHARLGGEMLQAISFLSPARDVPLCHHEAWDGSGYPAGLAGESIPLHARIFAVVDTYDALRSERSYKRAHPHAETVELLREAAGIRLDPEIVERFAAEPAGCWERLAASAAGEHDFPGALAAARAALR